MKLLRPLVVLDLETTGVWIEKDKIIEIGMVKTFPDGRVENYLKRINPQIPIPQVVTELTGISDADVAQSPLFKSVAQEVLAFIEGADLGGFNIEGFDLPILARELQEIGITFVWSNRTIYDAQTIYRYHEKRDLSAAYQFYCQRKLEGAHNALADSEATLEILKQQLARYIGDQQEIESLKAFDVKRRNDYFDDERRFRWWHNELYMMFGKYAKKDSLRAIAQKDPQYLQWILTKDFSDGVKALVKGSLEGKFPTPP